MMMKPLSTSHVLILGLGESGLAMARWCARSGARVRVADSRENPPGMAALQAEFSQVEIVPGCLDNTLLEGIDGVLLSPGVDPRQDPVKTARLRGLPIAGEMDLLAQALAQRDARAQCKILGVTGTNGKTTTTALAAFLLQQNGWDAVAAGNISPAALDVLMERLASDQPLPQCLVLELSSFQLEAFEGLACDAAVVLNVTEDHLDRYNAFEDYAHTKAKIFTGQGRMVLNRQDPRVWAMRQPGREVVSFGTDAPPGARDFGLIEKAGVSWLAQGATPLIESRSLPLAGLHNTANVLAALALCEVTGVPLRNLVAAVPRFKGLAHRVEKVGLRGDDVVFIDDSKGTNVGATLAALEGLGRQVILIAGGDGKGQDFSPLASAVAQHARAVVLIGRDAPLIQTALAQTSVPVYPEPTLEAAVVKADSLAQSGDAVLLSPACASLDMFRNYAHRAAVFIEAVHRLPGVRA